MSNANTATAITGDNGTIFHTTDAGANWIDQSYSTLDDLMDVCFTDANTGWAVGWKGIILHTTDGGENWVRQSSGTSSYLYGISITNANIGTVVGDNGTILRATTGGLTWIKEGHNSNLPQKHLLKQNYPNPFNPVTTITYQLPTQSHVTLKIFDILGREVATLVNGVEEPGYKTVTLDVGAIHESPLPSGVYFYRIQARPTDGGQAGDFIETKKLLLLR